MLLSNTELEHAMTTLADWAVTEDNQAITRQFVFDDFNQAFGFMTRVALAAEAMDHHPEWSNVYNRVDVRLTTHSAGGITEKDIKLAMMMNRYAGTAS